MKIRKGHCTIWNWNKDDKGLRAHMKNVKMVYHFRHVYSSASQSRQLRQQQTPLATVPYAIHHYSNKSNRTAMIATEVSQVRAGDKLRHAAITNQIPASALHHHSTSVVQKQGRQSVLNPLEKALIVQIILDQADLGVPFTEGPLSDVINRLCARLDLCDDSY